MVWPFFKDVHEANKLITHYDFCTWDSDLPDKPGGMRVPFEMRERILQLTLGIVCCGLLTLTEYVPLFFSAEEGSARWFYQLIAFPALWFLLCWNLRTKFEQK
tara:strand:- start:371 stop:679 length:309 start_codon:yes stop_codon:yes gene_type:complete